MEAGCPVVSIITPCYNAAKYIEETIKSVLSQTFTNWEWLIIDDCSSDNSAEIIKKFKNNDARIRYFKTPSNTGSPAIPRNIGIEHSRGQYIALLDSDDVWYPSKLEDQLSLMQKMPCRISYTDGVMMNEKGEIIRTMKKASWVDYKRTLKRNELSCSSVVLDKNLIGELRFQNIPKEDFAFWIQLMKGTKEKAYNTHKIHYSYRIVGNSRSRNKVNIIKQHWHVLRQSAGLNWVEALYCFTCWASRNIKKYYLK